MNRTFTHAKSGFTALFLSFAIFLSYLGEAAIPADKAVTNDSGSRKTTSQPLAYDKAQEAYFAPGLDFPKEPIYIGIKDRFSLWIPVHNYENVAAITVESATLPFLQEHYAGYESGSLFIYTDPFNPPTAAHAGAHELLVKIENMQGGSTTEKLTLIVDAACFNQYWFRDQDKDGFGHYPQQIVCSQPTGYVDNEMDCDDNNAAIHPQAPEIAGDGIDNNCNYETDEAATNRAPMFTYSYLQRSDVGDELKITVKAIDPDLADQVNLQIDSVMVYEGTISIHQTGASFSPALPLTASGTATTVMSWTPKREQRGFIEFYFSAQDQHGNLTVGNMMYFVDVPLQIKPVPSFQLAVNQPFESILTITEADWHQTYEAKLLEEAPHWLNVELTNINGENVIRLWGTPDRAAAGTHQYTVYTETIFGKWDTQLIQIVVTNGKNQHWYRDEDGDGFGSLADGARLSSINAPEGFANNTKDCNDANAAIHPNATEIPGDGLDNNCDGKVDEAANCQALQQLALTASCSDNPASERKWRIYNPNNCAVAINWWIHKSSQKGTMLVPAGESYFTTTSVSKGVDMAYISWKDAQGKTRQKNANAATAKCNKPKNKGKNQSTAEEPITAELLQAYPMPFSRQLFVSHGSITAASAVQVQLITLEGKQYDLSRQTTIVGEGKIELELQQSGIPAGLYVLKLWVDDATPVFIRVIKSIE